ncbi:MAG: LysM peptidoglycan-binding domain-containing protein [bacterium]|nr:LysM peptidoglycan-binding domain-containing protein [bacterium]
MNRQRLRKLILLSILLLASARLTIAAEEGEHSFLWLKDKLDKLPFQHLVLDPDARIYTLPLGDGQEAVSTIQPDLQRMAERALTLYNINYGSVVILNPKTGAVLAMAGYKQGNSSYSLDNDSCNLANSLALKARHPAASIIKVITASAALENKVARPESTFSCSGKLIDRRDGCLLSDPTHVRHGEIDLSLALAKSCNVTFGKVAALLGPASLKEYTRRFGFDEALDFDLSVEPSRATVPGNIKGLARAGAGFGDVMMSPLHGALLAATVANHGRMFRPYLFAEVRDETGKLLFRQEPQVMMRPVEAATAYQIGRMMEETITEGTARRSFYKQGKPILPVEIAGKTGTLTGGNPNGVCTWFVGFAPADDPRIAISVLVVNHSRSGTKSTRIASRVLAAYFEVDPIPEKKYIATNSPQKYEKRYAATNSPPKYHVVKRGENLWTIAGKYKVSLKVLKQANRLHSSSLKVGQKLAIPGRGGTSISSDSLVALRPEVAPPVKIVASASAGHSIPAARPTKLHVVKKGDSLWKIAEKYGVSWKDLKRVNSLRSNHLKVGQKLTVPGSREKQVTSASDAHFASADQPAKLHVVKKGESLWEIAEKYGVSWKDLKRVNSLRSNRLTVGQELTVPG